MPAKAAPEVLNKVSDAVHAALAAPDVVDALGLMGLESKGST